MKPISISIYGSHDSSVSVIFDSENIKIFELERFTKNRHGALSRKLENHLDLGRIGTPLNQVIKYYNYIKEYINKQGFFVNKIYYLELDGNDIQILKNIFTECNEFQIYSHHDAHCRSALYQSPYDKAIVISFDGGGMNYDGISYTNIYIDSKNTTDSPNRISKINLDLGTPYGWMGKFVKYINKDNTLPNLYPKLPFAGKIMGLVAYGKVREEWVTKIENYYRTCHHNPQLGDNLGFKYDSLENDDAFDLAATSQHVFEKLSYEILLPIIGRYPNLPIVLAGGCALNVLFNQKLKEKTNREIFVPCNPNDCGLSFGGLLLNENQCDKILDVTYSGFDILDRDEFESLTVQYEVKDINFDFLIGELSKGKIFATIIGSSECGPRALGNRSIIVYPVFPKMKEILNQKVKFREWFRPFAPVCKLEHVSEYFEYEGESKFMSFAPKVKKEFIDKLISISHEDGTARVQTVTEKQHSFLYKLLSHMESNGLHGVLLNTSFNIKGYPILTSIKDALYVLENTELDYLIFENKVISKNK